MEPKSKSEARRLAIQQEAPQEEEFVLGQACDPSKMEECESCQ